MLGEVILFFSYVLLFGLFFAWVFEVSEEVGKKRRIFNLVCMVSVFCLLTSWSVINGFRASMSLGFGYLATASIIFICSLVIRKPLTKLMYKVVS